MSSYESRIPHYVEGKNEEEVRQKLVTIGMQLQQKVEVSSIYFNGARGKVVAWYFHDIKSNVPLPPTGSKTTKKKTKKKVTKKA